MIGRKFFGAEKYCISKIISLPAQKKVGISRLFKAMLVDNDGEVMAVKLFYVVRRKKFKSRDVNTQTQTKRNTGDKMTRSATVLEKGKELFRFFCKPIKFS